VYVCFLGIIGLIIRFYCLQYNYILRLCVYVLCVWETLPELNKLDLIGIIGLNYRFNYLHYTTAICVQFVRVHTVTELFVSSVHCPSNTVTYS